MQKALLARTRPAPAWPGHHRAMDTRHHSLHPASPERRTDGQFVVMLEAYRDSGGIAGAPEVLALFRRNYGPDHATLAKWVASRQVLCFEWQAQAWFPWFQFDRRSLLPQPQLRPVLDELTPIYDPWQLASWFARPNPWLSDHTPVAALGLDLAAVVHAARAEGFIVRG